MNTCSLLFCFSYFAFFLFDVCHCIYICVCFFAFLCYHKLVNKDLYKRPLSAAIMFMAYSEYRMRFFSQANQREKLCRISSQSYFAAKPANLTVRALKFVIHGGDLSTRVDRQRTGKRRQTDNWKTQRDFVRAKCRDVDNKKLSAEGTVLHGIAKGVTDDRANRAQWAAYSERRRMRSCRAGVWRTLSQQELSSGWDGRPCQSKVGRKLGTAVSLSVGRAESPSNTMWLGPRPTSVPSGILIHTTVWPQYTATDRQDRTGQTTVR